MATHTSCNKRISYAWARYYASMAERHTTDYRHYQILRNKVVEEIPQHIRDCLLSMGAELKKTWDCPVCLEMIEPANLEITNCGHFFCKDCIVKYKAEHTDDCKCPICRKPIRQ